MYKMSKKKFLDPNEDGKIHVYYMVRFFYDSPFNFEISVNFGDWDLNFRM